MGGRHWNLKAGDLYLVGPTDRHRMTATSPEVFRVVSVFNPPIAGLETHDADNSYTASGPIPPRAERMLVRTPDDVRTAGHLQDLGGTGSIAHFITKSDQVGFSYAAVRLKPGHRSEHKYKHSAACLVLEGALEVSDPGTGGIQRLGPGGLFCARPEEAHSIHAVDEVHMIAVFNPPLTGSEGFGSDGGDKVDGSGS